MVVTAATRLLEMFQRNQMGRGVGLVLTKITRTWRCSTCRRTGSGRSDTAAGARGSSSERGVLIVEVEDDVLGHKDSNGER